MPTPTLLNLIPKEMIQPLKTLGRHEWLAWTPADCDVPRTEYRLNIPDNLHVAPLFLNRLRRMEDNNPTPLPRLFAYSKLIASGPKVLRPTAEQCEALEHVDVNLPFSEYEQPFPVFLAELPEAYRRTLSQRCAHPCPRLVMCFHDRPSGYIFTSAEYGPERNCTFSIMRPHPRWASIEDALRFSFEPDGPDLRIGEVVYRVAINFGLLLTRYGVKDCGPLDPQWYAEQKRRAKARKGHKAQRAQDFLDAAMHRIDFRQEVVFYDSVKQHHTGPPDAEGVSKRPHWRRGHFRRQPYGVGRTERRLVFVRPCFINAERFHGDKANTEYRIVAQSLPTSGGIQTVHAAQKSEALADLLP